MVQTILPDGTRIETTFDNLDRPIRETDPSGAATHFAYDAVGNLAGATDALGGVTQFAYDEAGNQMARTDALGRVTQWTYDALDRMTGRILPLGQTESWAYDVSGNPSSMIGFNGDATHFLYDQRNRLIEKIFADGTGVRYSYTATGQRASVTDSRGTTFYHYDDWDRLIRVDDPDGAWLEYGYDASGNRTEIATPFGTTRYAFDALNRLTSVTDPDGGVSSYQYDAVGNLTRLVQANGTVTQYSHDPRNLLTSLATRDAAGALIVGYDYVLDANGRRVSATDHTGRAVFYRYDALGRLTEETTQDPLTGTEIIAYSHDAVGNRLQKTDFNGVQNYGYDANDRLLSVDGDTFAYDDNGNLLTAVEDGQTTAYFYDPENRLVAATTPDAAVSLIYDADGLLREKTINGVSVSLLVDANRRYAQVLAEYEDAHDGASAEYVYGHQRLSRHRGSTVRYYHHDGHGSVVALTDENEAITDAYHYDPFGLMLETEGESENPYRYTGEAYDEELGLYYLRARHYNPEQGRFPTRDAWPGRDHDPLSLNQYLYGHADPINRTDPSGNITLTEVSNVVNQGYRMLRNIDRFLRVVEKVETVISVVDFIRSFFTIQADIGSLIEHVQASVGPTRESE